MHRDLTEPEAKHLDGNGRADHVTYPSLDEFLNANRGNGLKGPLALVFAEDEIALDETLNHLVRRGFDPVLALIPDSFTLSSDTAGAVHRIQFDCTRENVFEAVNATIDAAPGSWIHYCYNAEFLFYPFCETRSVSELLTFHAEERRESMLTYVVDLYAGDLQKYPDAVSLDDAMFDGSGYYALNRPETETGHPRDRQLDFFGGLRWRFEEHVPKGSRRIDRISLFRAKRGLRLLRDHTFSEPEYNTYACSWHHNLTATVCSFRAAKALKCNPGSAAAIASFHWQKSVPFEWTSQQLLDFGLMEPGQWF